MAAEPKTEAFQVYSMDHPNLPRTLRGRLAEQQTRLLAQLLASLDWPDFKERRGRIQGLTDAMKLCDEMEREQRQ